MAHVLVVDDDVDLQDALVAAFAIGGHQVSVASNGREALDAVRGDRIDVIVLDIMMPVMDGVQFRAEQVRDPAIADIPVVVISAASPIPRIDAAEILPKPLNLDALLAAVARHGDRG
jgi:CheY-like chemotaxis protein